MIPFSEFLARRQQLLASIPADAIVFLSAASDVIRNGDTHFPFRQDSDFWYLTGFNEPDAIVVFAPHCPMGHYGLFCLPKDPSAERWTGRRVGPDVSVKEYGASVAYARDTFDAMFEPWMKARTTIYLPLTAQPVFSKYILKLAHQLAKGHSLPWKVVDVGTILGEMRIVKSINEQSVMRQTVHYAAQGHIALMQCCKPGMHEYELAAQFRYTTALQGATEMAYPPIVANGPNACILHYTENGVPLTKDACVLVDAGCEWHYYASDITRTFPVSGIFSGSQRALYEVVLSAQLAAIALIKPGVTWEVLDIAAGRVLVEGLSALGFLQGDPELLLEEKKYRQWFIHGLGHWLGLNVHDVGAYKIDGNPRVFEPGMVLTIEPGLYIDEQDHAVKEQYRGIGIRIEDDVLVTDTGCEVFSLHVPKTIDAIEMCMRG